MPPVSRKQAKAMFAAEEGRSTLGIPRDVGAEFISSLVGHPGSVNALPAKAAASARSVDKSADVPHIHIHLHG